MMSLFPTYHVVFGFQPKTAVTTLSRARSYRPVATWLHQHEPGRHDTHLQTHIKQGAIGVKLTPAVWERVSPFCFFFPFVCTVAFCTRDVAGWRHISRYLLSGEALMSWGELSTSHTQSHMLPKQCRHILVQSGMRSGTRVGQHACNCTSHTPSLCGEEEEKKQWTTNPKAFPLVKYMDRIICNHE